MIVLLVLSPILGVAYHYVNVSNSIVSGLILYSNMFLNQGLYSIIIGSLAAVLLCKFRVTIKLNPYIVGTFQFILAYLVWFFFSHPMSGGINLLIESTILAILIVSANKKLIVSIRPCVRVR